MYRPYLNSTRGPGSSGLQPRRVLHRLLRQHRGRVASHTHPIFILIAIQARAHFLGALASFVFIVCTATADYKGTSFFYKIIIVNMKVGMIYIITDGNAQLPTTRRDAPELHPPTTSPHYATVRIQHLSTWASCTIFWGAM